MIKVPEQYRYRSDDKFGTTENDGNNGLFLVPYGSDLLQCIVSDGLGWEHVSVCCRTKNRAKYSIPNWEQMCYIKELFWDDEDVVIQFHPKKSEYVNNHNFVLHLWRSLDKEVPNPPSILVGVKL